MHRRRIAVLHDPGRRDAAARQGANGIINVEFELLGASQGASQVVVHGTAVVIKPIVNHVPVGAAGNILAVPTILLSHPRVYKRMPRAARDLLRGSMGLLIVSCGALLLSGSLVAGALLSIAVFAFWRFYFRLRRGRRLAACDGCPELNAGGICHGFAHQAECVRNYEREATEMLYPISPTCPQTTARRPEGPAGQWRK